MSAFPRVAFQGEHGAFSEEAALRLLGACIRLVARPTLESLFLAIEEEAADALIVPVENSVAGPIELAQDLFVRSGLVASAEIEHRIVQNLIGLPGAKLADVAFVQSHPVALAQCGKFFRASPGIKPVEAEDTAGSVREVMARGDLRWAALGSKRAAWIYGGKILREHVEDDRDNYTRFLLLARSEENLPAFTIPSHVLA
jgi:prephenate dehydratase